MNTSSKKRLKIARIAALILVICLSVFIFIIRDRAKELAVYGYPGIFLFAFIAYATVLVPAPGWVVVFTMGAVFHPVGVALAAALGAGFGELSGYLAGFSGQAVIERVDIYQRMLLWMQKNGALTIFLLAALPNPFFDVAGIVAGALKMPVRIFFIWCLLGQIIKMLFFAYAGAGILH